MDFRILSGGGPGSCPGPAQATAMQGLAQVRAYWEALRQDGGIPARSDLDPRGLSTVLDRVIVAERLGAGLAQIRIAGNVLSELTGMEARGLPLSCLFAAEARSRLGALVERVFAAPIAAELHLEAERGFGRRALEARLLLLPLLDGTGQRSLLLGCLVPDGDIGRAPCRFRIVRAVEERLLLAVAPQQPAIAVPAPVVKAMQRGHLRLVHSA